MNDKQPMKHTGFRLTDQQRKRLDVEAKRRKRDRSWVLREILNRHYKIETTANNN